MNVVDTRYRFVKYWLLENGGLTRRGVAMALSTLLGCSIVSSTDAGTVTAGQSNAYGLSAGITVQVPVVASVTLTVPQEPAVTGTAPAPYSTPGTLASIDASVSAGVVPAVVASVDSGVLNVLASSTVDGSPGSMNAFASSMVTGLGVSVGPGGDLLKITSGTDVLTETSTASGTGGVLTTAGSLTIAGSSNVVITVLGTVVATLTAGEVIAPNTVVPLLGPLLGLGTITLNEQTLDPGTNDTTIAGITSNFLDLSLNPSVLGVASADIDIVVDHTHASLMGTAVPEPSSLVLSSLGILTCLGGLFVRRRFA